MDEPKYSTLLEALSAVPDPRKARGKQYSWVLLLTLVSSALGSGERSGHGIASWVVEHTEALLLCLRPERGRLPSESTLRRALRQVDVVLVGDLFYAPELAVRVSAFLARCVAAGVTVLVGDPYRAHLPLGALEVVAEYEVADFGEAAGRRSGVFRFLG